MQGANKQTTTPTGTWKTTKKTSTLAESYVRQQVHRGAIFEETSTRPQRAPPPGPAAELRTTSQQTRVAIAPAAEGRPARAPATPPPGEKQARPRATPPSEGEHAHFPGAPPAERKQQWTLPRAPNPLHLVEHGTVQLEGEVDRLNRGASRIVRRA